MIKIIKDGQKEFTAKCDTCGCEFSYQLVDIGLGSVVCPCCGGYVAHKINEPEEPSFSTGSPYKITPSSTADCTAQNVVLASSDNTSRSDSLQLIHDLCIDYDGFNTVDGLKSLIDDIRNIAEKNLNDVGGRNE